MGQSALGVLWLDKNSFQIIRMRTDLLAQRNAVRLDQLTTVVTFFGVHLQDIAKPLWLPNDVDVYLTIDNRKFRTVQHYMNYRRYRVSVKIGAPQSPRRAFHNVFVRVLKRTQYDLHPHAGCGATCGRSERCLVSAFNNTC